MRIVVALSLAAMTINALAQDASPTAKDAVSFIEQRWNEVLKYNDTPSGEVTLDEARQVLILRDNRRSREVPLKECDPSRVRVTSGTAFGGVTPYYVHVPRTQGDDYFDMRVMSREDAGRA